MQHQSSSICIVASTMPAGFIASQVEELGVNKIIVASENLELSYRVFKERHPAIKVVCIPTGFVAQTLFLLTELSGARLRGDRVVFFHECCMPLLDLLVMLIRPRGFYFPHSTMSQWEEIEFEQFPKGRITNIIRIFGLANRFICYRSPGVGSNETEYVISLKKYPNSIVSKDVSFVRKITSSGSERCDGFSKKVLFITSKSFVSDAVQIELYMNLLDIAHTEGYGCYIKDHPNPIYRLNITSESATNYDPLMPSELLGQDFHIVVGVSSTALLAYGRRSISLLNILPTMSMANRVACVKTFEELALQGNGISYIDSISEFEKLL